MYFDETGLAMVASPEAAHLVGMDSEYVQTQCIFADGAERFGVSAIAFDKTEELVWMGNQGGHVTSYFTGAMQKYTSFQVHATQDVRQIITVDNGILALTASSLRYQMRRGIPLLTHTGPNLNEMQCMLQVSPSRILMGGHQSKLIDFNIEYSRELTTVDVGDTGCVMMRPHSRFVLCGNPLGRIDLRDPISLNVEHKLETHSGSLSDFDVQGNLLVTCGFSTRHGNLTVDRFLKVYDLRMMRAISPIAVVTDPLYLRFLPSVSSRLVVVSGIGQIQLCDTIALAEPRICLHQIDPPGGMCMTFDISASSQAMAFGDNMGQIHLFSTCPEPIFNTYSNITEHADHVLQIPSFDIGDFNVPLASVPMPVVGPHVTLSSTWPEQLTQKVYRKAPRIDPEILRTMKMQGPIGYAPNPRNVRRNQVIYNLGRNGYPMSSKHAPENKAKISDDNSNFVAIPKRYRKLDVKYNKLGSDDFQFDQYNKTVFSGLESTLPNAYCNGMLQVLYFSEPLRAALMSHLCDKEFCLSCELGFLFHMLSLSNTVPCQPGNFLRAFRTVPEASALSLILSDLHAEAKSKVDLCALIQSWNRFMLHQMHVELIENKKKKEERKATRKPFVYRETDFPKISNERKRSNGGISEIKIEEEKREEESEISNLFGTKQLQINKCLKCSNTVKKESMSLACNLNYPTYEPERDEWSFCDILKRSLCPQQTTPAWCDYCGKFTPTTQRRILQSLPKLLAINTGLHNPAHKQFWQNQMDKVVAKANIPDTIRSSTPNPGMSTKPCRYGDSCSRLGCRFRHSFDNAPPPIPSNNPYCSNNWLPLSLHMSLKNDILTIVKEEEDKSTSVKENGIDHSNELSTNYQLSAVVCYVKDTGTNGNNDKHNLVALIKVPDCYIPKGVEISDNKWYLFNDFSICPVPAQEVVWFSLDWKTPCVLFYSTPEVLGASTEVHPTLTREVFTEDVCLARNGGTAGITFTPLNDSETLKPGDLVAMDAEFVTLNQEESELRSDGKLSTVKPSQMSVARITCIRGQGILEGTPFIDDYISTQEQVVDYLTKFSGIKPGDLDANFSSKHLTTLKSTYMKLRYLQDIGVIFVGHGLKNDFRVINLVVPPEQVVDTVFLFHLPHHRMVSLRFLAWHFLGSKIQAETHDSVEDARAALQLYKKYKQLEAQNKVGEALAELYERGKMLNWKVPPD
ncbi:PAN2-PAN3 deadenylation complex catalytic subunit PAN2 [Coccinella septempunctata]|uniref:PAN2-PAN3 deadenylation complex catalytic subunit PAN2 n=1 Tax=Coccinella septempunctata TaxID=41139 RepID=UPI001D084F9C|nr:PAN2-PAN3 deadenylation complex catalytic subunit PAN2 [Coccinella septempunctata]